MIGIVNWNYLNIYTQWLYCVALFSTPLLAQNPELSFQHFSIEEGLPSSEVYHTLQDRYGYLWFATDKGISKFDGYDFQNFSTKDGLPQNVVFILQEDGEGRIWFNTIDNQFGYLKNNTVTTVAQINRIDCWVGNFMVDKDTVFVACNNSDYYFKILPNGDTEQIPVYPNYPNCMHILTLDSTRFINSFKHTDDKVAVFPYYFLKEEIRGLSNSSSILYKEMDSYVRMAKDNAHFFQNSLNQLQRIFPNKNGSTYNLPALVNTIIEEEGGSKLWVGMKKKGIARIENNRIQYYLKDYSVSSIIKDRDGGYWFATLEDGVFYLPHEHSVNYSIGKVKDISPFKNNIRLVHFKTSLSEMVGDSLNLLWVDDNEIAHVFSFKGNFKVGVFGKPNENIQHSEFKLHSGTTKAMVVDNGDIWFGSPGGLGIHNDLHQDFVPQLLIGKVKAMSHRGHEIYVGTTQGLYRIDSFFRVDTILRNEHITSLYCDKEYVYAGTKGSGARIFTANGEEIESLNSENGFISDFINVVKVHEGNLWVGTNRGVAIVSKIVKGQKPKIQTLNQGHGLLSEDVTAIYINNKKAYIGNAKGLSVFPLVNLKRKLSTLPILFNQINDSILAKPSPGTLRFLDHDIKINFSSISFKNSGNLKYRFRLLGTNESWDWTDQRSVYYKNLSPKDYIFEVVAVLNSRESKVGQLHFTVLPFYWQSWWFSALIILTVLTIVYGFFQFRMRQIREKNRLNSQNLELTHQTISAQMNPHFTSNALLSIQNLVLQKQTDEALRYLAGFGHLLRNTMSHTASLYISLDKEMEMIHDYVELEQLRFQREIQVRWFNQTGKKDSEIRIPTMMIQPLVENAIRHGFLSLSRNGCIDITLIAESNLLLRIEVVDNGVGMEEEIQGNIPQKAKHRESKALKLLNERLHIFTKLTGVKMRFDISSIKDDKNQIVGTKVLVNTPFKT